jgi:hypothetical protein
MELMEQAAAFMQQIGHATRAQKYTEGLERLRALTGITSFGSTET